MTTKASNGQKVKPDAHPLVGKCFVVFRENKKASVQGIVRAVMGDLCLVQFFEWLMGEPSTLKIVRMEDMVSAPLDRGVGKWEFFEDDEHLRSWLESRGCE